MYYQSSLQFTDFLSPEHFCDIINRGESIDFDFICRGFSKNEKGIVVTGSSTDFNSEITITLTGKTMVITTNDGTQLVDFTYNTEKSIRDEINKLGSSILSRIYLKTSFAPFGNDSKLQIRVQKI